VRLGTSLREVSDLLTGGLAWGRNAVLKVRTLHSTLAAWHCEGTSVFHSVLHTGAEMGLVVLKARALQVTTWISAVLKDYH